MRPWIVLLACVGCGGAPFTTAAYFVDGGPETGPETGVPASPRDSGGAISTTDCGSPANGEPGITATGGGTCITWIYAGGLAGSSIKVAGGQCDCPGITENPWN